MKQTDSGVKSTDDSVEANEKTIENPRWRFEWSNIRDGAGVFVR